MRPLTFQPPYPLTWSPELWVLARGRDEDDQPWSGAEVHWTEDETWAVEYGPVRIGAGAVVGELVTTLPATECADGVRIALSGGELKTVTPEAARRGQSLALLGEGIDAEVIAFTGMRLAGTWHGDPCYRMDGLLRRGLYGTAVRLHEPGTRFARLDERAVARILLPHRLVSIQARLWLRIGDVDPLPDEDAGPDTAKQQPFAVDLRWPNGFPGG